MNATAKRFSLNRRTSERQGASKGRDHASLWPVVFLFTLSFWLASCAGHQNKVGSAQPMSVRALPISEEIQTVILLSPQIAVTDLRGRVPEEALAADAAPVRDYLLQAASAALGQRTRVATVLMPEVIESRLGSHNEVLSRLTGAAMETVYSGRCDPGLVMALVNALGADARSTAVMFTTVEARLSYDRSARTLVLTGGAETHTSLIRSAAFVPRSATSVWANSVFARSRPKIDSKVFREAVVLLFQPL